MINLIYFQKVGYSMPQPKALKAYWANKNHNRHVIAMKEHSRGIGRGDHSTITEKQQSDMLDNMFAQRKYVNRKTKTH
jgi:hypothetical protein